MIMRCLHGKCALARTRLGAIHSSGAGLVCCVQGRYVGGRSRPAGCQSAREFFRMSATTLEVTEVAGAAGQWRAVMEAPLVSVLVTGGTQKLPQTVQPVYVIQACVSMAERARPETPGRATSLAAAQLTTSTHSA